MCALMAAQCYYDKGLHSNPDVEVSSRYRFLTVFYSLFQGEQGVAAVLQMLRDELKVAMALAGQ